MLSCLLKKNRIFEFPFWAGAIALGWFLPQAIGGYRNIENYPNGVFGGALLFASFCTVALWGGYELGIRAVKQRNSWLNVRFDESRLVVTGAILCVTGFFFAWKLAHLPKELTSVAQWSGTTVKYLFLASIFHFGFIILWFVYLNRRKLVEPRLFVYIIPGLLQLLETAFVYGRRAGMMTLVSYVLVGIWFVRRWMMPRWIMIAGVMVGLLLVNSIELYRNTMNQKDTSLINRLKEVASSNLANESADIAIQSAAEFKNYAFCRQVYSEEGRYYWGLMHWNRFVWNYVPAQIVGRAVKNSMMFDLKDYGYELASQRYGHHYLTGTTGTGYKDAFLSYGWFGFVKFLIIGWMMGSLYRHAMLGSFLGQFLYVYMLKDAMQSISHGTHAILISSWVYFFVLGYPMLRWARFRAPAVVPYFKEKEVADQLTYVTITR